jgi:hypothetical protein
MLLFADQSIGRLFLLVKGNFDNSEAGTLSDIVVQAEQKLVMKP